MKKILVIATLAAFAAVSSYGQGYINFQGFLHNVGNNYTTPGTVTYNTGIDVELLFAPASTPTAVSSIANSSSPASLTYSIATAWADIMGNMPTFQPVDGTNGTPVAVFQSAANGGGTYNASAAYSVPNLLSTGTTYTFYEVAWYTGASGQYSTLALANGNTYVGWSQPFSTLRPLLEFPRQPLSLPRWLAITWLVALFLNLRRLRWRVWAAFTFVVPSA